MVKLLGFLYYWTIWRQYDSQDSLLNVVLTELQCQTKPLTRPHDLELHIKNKSLCETSPPIYLMLDFLYHCNVPLRKAIVTNDRSVCIKLQYVTELSDNTLAGGRVLYFRGIHRSMFCLVIRKWPKLMQCLGFLYMVMFLLLKCELEEYKANPSAVLKTSGCGRSGTHTG